LNFIDGFTPAMAGNTTFKVMSAISLNGQFKQVDIYKNGVYQYTNGAGTGSTQPTLTVGLVTPHALYNFKGFFPPVDNGKLNAAIAGIPIPVIFSLSGNQGLDIFAFGEGYPKSRQIDCNTLASMDDIRSTVPVGSSGLFYVPLVKLYTYGWKTDKAWSKTCRQFQMKFNDGMIYGANFKFK
jgi:hypothetical protein